MKIKGVEFDAKPMILQAFDWVKDQVVSASAVGERLGLSEDQVKLLAQKIGMTGKFKGEKRRWSFSVLDIRTMQIYIKALEKGHKEETALNVAKRLSKVLDDIYGFPSQLQYKIRIFIDPKKKVSSKKVREIEAKFDEVIKVNSLLEDHSVLIGFGGKVSMLAFFLKEEILEGMIVVQLVPKAKPSEKSVADELKAIRRDFERKEEVDL